MKRTLYFYFLHTPAFKDILNDQTGNLKHHSPLEYKKSTEPYKALSPESHCLCLCLPTNVAMVFPWHESRTHLDIQRKINCLSTNFLKYSLCKLGTNKHSCPLQWTHSLWCHMLKSSCQMLVKSQRDLKSSKDISKFLEKQNLCDQY